MYVLKWQHNQPMIDLFKELVFSAIDFFFRISFINALIFIIFFL